MYIPETFGDVYDEKLINNVITQTDLHIDELFNVSNSDNFKPLMFNYNRFYCDVERYWSDELEPMSKIGQGVYYEKYLDGTDINRTDTKYDIKSVYDTHHTLLNYVSANLIKKYGSCLIVDCHSFNDRYDVPDICIGLNNDKNDVDPVTLSKIIKHFNDNGYSTDINNPYTGSIYPSNYKHKNLKTVMIEINKRVYLNDDFSKDVIKFEKLNNVIKKLFNVI